ncbi:MAG: hypothetical protein ACE5I1_01195 [bacterium]
MKEQGTILVGDSNVAFRETLYNHLLASGKTDIYAPNSGAQIRELLSTIPFDLILVELSLVLCHNLQTLLESQHALYNNRIYLLISEEDERAENAIRKHRIKFPSVLKSQIMLALPHILQVH